MSYNNPPGGVYMPGINHVGAYQVSGRPFCSGSIDGNTGTAVAIEFPYVTKWVQIVNHSTDELYVAFHENQVPVYDTNTSTWSSTANHFKIHGVHTGGSKEGGFPQIMELKTTELHLTGSGDFDVIAGLTNIPASRMYDTTGLAGIDD